MGDQGTNEHFLSLTRHVWGIGKSLLNKNQRMQIEIENFSGEGIVAAIDVLMEFRLRYFREFPYLYVGRISTIVGDG